MDMAYSTSVIQISKQEAILDTRATGNFFLPGTPVKKLQPKVLGVLIANIFNSLWPLYCKDVWVYLSYKP